MNNSQRLRILIDSGRTVFRLEDMRTLWGSESDSLRITAKRMVDSGLLFRYARGYYGIRREPHMFELANLIVTPSYVSLHSALVHHNISFQVSSVITSVGLMHYRKKIGDTCFEYCSMKETLFFPLEGIDYLASFSMAKPERAILDSLYFGYLPNIDNPGNLNVTYLKRLAKVYPRSVQAKIGRVVEETT